MANQESAHITNTKKKEFFDFDSRLLEFFRNQVYMLSESVECTIQIFIFSTKMNENVSFPQFRFVLW